MRRYRTGWSFILSMTLLLLKLPLILLKLPFIIVRTFFRLFLRSGPITIDLARAGGSLGGWLGMGARAESSERHLLETGETAVLKLSNAHGCVDVESWDRAELEIKVTKGARARDQEEAQQLLDAIEIEVKQDGSRIEVATHYPDGVGRWRRSMWANYRIRVPLRTDLSVKNRHGPISISQIEGTVAVEAAHGNCKIGEIKGDLSVNNRHGSISVSHVEGGAVIGVAHGSIGIGEIKGGLKASGRHGSIRVDNLLGNFDLQAQHGGIRINARPDQTGQCVAEARHGGITLGLPADTDASIQTSARHGSLRSDFEFDKVERTAGHRSSAVREGDGAEIRLTAEHGNITITRLGSVD